MNIKFNHKYEAMRQTQGSKHKHRKYFLGNNRTYKSS